MKTKSNSGYPRAVLWFLLSLFVSSLNDVITKYLNTNISPYEIVFFRFFFGALFLVPFMFKDLSSFKTSRLHIHATRGALLFGGILFWCMGLSVVKVTTATVINFTIPIFTLILASIVLKENLNFFRIVATILGFVGIVVVINPSSLEFNVISVFLILASLMFASLDVINKKFVNEESMLSMLFYSSFFTMLFSLIPAIRSWVMPSMHDIFLLLLLGAGANFILYCLLKALSVIDASGVAPYRYTELIFSAVLGYLIFEEVPHSTTLIGALVIIASTLLIAYEFFLKQTSLVAVKKS